MVQNPGNDDGVVSISSPFAFAETVQRLLAAFLAHAIKVFATIDQQAEAAAVDLAMPPTTIIFFGNPKAGTPLMLAQPRSGIDLPLKVLVRESVPGTVLVEFNSPQYLVQRHGLPADLVANLAPARALIEQTLRP